MMNIDYHIADKLRDVELLAARRYIAGLEGKVERLLAFVVERVCFRCSEDFMLDGSVEEDCGEMECQEARSVLAPEGEETTG